MYSSNWDKLYQTSDFDVIFDLLLIPLFKCLRHTLQYKSVLSEKWISKTTRQLMINREKFLNDENFKQFFSCHENPSNSFSEDYKKFHQNLIEAAESDRKEWLLINEIRNSKKTQPNITCLKNCVQRLCHRP